MSPEKAVSLCTLPRHRSRRRSDSVPQGMAIKNQCERCVTGCVLLVLLVTFHDHAGFLWTWLAWFLVALSVRGRGWKASMLAADSCVPWSKLQGRITGWTISKEMSSRCLAQRRHHVFGIRNHRSDPAESSPVHKLPLSRFTLIFLSTFSS
jgi:hypothetical protein